MLKRFFLYVAIFPFFFFSCSFPGLNKSILESYGLLRVFQTNTTYSVSFQVSGLLGSGLEIENKGEVFPAISKNGVYQFQTKYPAQSSYDVKIKTKPTKPPQDCKVSSGSGTILKGDITTIQIVCGDELLTMEGTAAGLLGSGLQIFNGRETRDINSTGFSFTPVEKNFAYSLSIAAQPTNPWQTCSMISPSPASGIVPSTGLTISVVCVTQSYPLSVQVVGIVGTLGVGSELQVQVNASETVTIATDGTYSFPTNRLSGSGYSLSVVNAGGNIISGVCTIPSPTGVMAGPTNIVMVNCSNGFLVQGTVTSPGGTASSIIGSGTVISLTNTGGTPFATQTLNLSAGATSFAFPTPIPGGSQYQVTVSTQPTTPNQTCALTGSTGPASISSNVSNLILDCNLPLPELATSAPTNFANTTNISLSAPVSGADFRYTLGNGAQSNPTCSTGTSTTTTIPISANPNNYIKAIQCRSGWTTSGLLTAGPYEMIAASPTPDKVSGTGLDQNESVNFTSTTMGAWTCYTAGTTTPTDPICSNTISTCTMGTVGSYSHPGINNQEVKVRACKVDYTQSTVQSLSYPVKDYFVRGTVSGLSGSGPILVKKNSDTDHSLLVNGSYSFPVKVASGAAYSVSVTTQPTYPWQTCSLSNATGTVTNADITNVNLSCVINTYTLGSGASGVTGLGTGESVTINYGSGPVVITDPSNSYTSPALNSGSSYNLSLTSSPPGKTCTISAPGPLLSGTVLGNNLTAQIICKTGKITSGTNFSKYPPAPLEFTTYQGTVSDFAGAGSAGIVDNLTGLSASFNSVVQTVTDGDNLYISQIGNPPTDVAVRRVSLTSSNAVSTLVGGAVCPGDVDGNLATAKLILPYGLATDGINIYVADNGGNKIRKIDLYKSQVTTVAGPSGGTNCNSGNVDSLNPNNARFSSPSHLVLLNGFLYVTDSGNHKIRRINLNTGEVDTFAGDGTSGNADAVGTAASFSSPYGITTDGISLFVTQASATFPRIRKINIVTKTVTTIAATNATNGGFSQGPADQASFQSGSNGIYSDGFKRLFIGDRLNHSLRMIDTVRNFTDTISGHTVSGSASGLGPVARFNRISSVTSVGSRMYAGDELNHKIRLVKETSLVGYWPLNGFPDETITPINWRDENSGNANSNSLNSIPNTLPGRPVYGIGRFGDTNGSLYFNGTQSLLLASPTGLPFGNSDRTFCAWVKSDFTSSNVALYTIFGYGTASLGSASGLALDITPSGAKRMYVFGYGNDLILNTNWVDAQWMHLCGSYRGSDNVASAYLNGNLIGREATPTAWNTINSEVRIGSQITGSQGFKGNISDIRIYNRVLNESEIAQLAGSNLPVGLVAHFKDGNYPDAGPLVLANTGSSPSGINLVVGKEGQASTAHNYLGTGGYSSYATEGLPIARASRTICGWIQPSDLIQGDSSIFLNYGNATANEFFALGLSNTDGKIRPKLYSGTDLEFDTMVPLNRWVHLCGSYAAGTQKLYMNGRFLASNTATSLNTGTTELRVGQFFSSGSPFKGKLDDLRIYNYELTESQIRYLSAQIPAGLIAYYDFNGDSSDVTGLGTSLINTNAAATSDRYGITSAYGFNGTNSQLFGTHSYLPQGLQSRSVCGWVRANVRPSVGQERAAFGFGGLQFARVAVKYDLTNYNQLVWGSGSTALTIQFRLPLNSWNHFCNVNDGTNSMVYLNGTLINTIAGSTASSSNIVHIGSSETSTSFWSGQLDDISFYNRSLSISEIRALSGPHPYQLGGSYTVGSGFANLKFYFDTQTKSDLAAGGSVNSWEDSSGYETGGLGLDLTAPGGYEPTYNLTGINGKPSIQFVDTSHQYMTRVCESSWNGAANSIFGIVNENSSGNNGVFQNGAQNAGKLLYLVNASSAKQLVLFDLQTNSLKIASTGAIKSGLETLLFGLHHNGTVGDIYKNGIIIPSSVAASTGYNCGGGPGAIFHLGRYYFGGTFPADGGYYNGNIGELIYYNNILSSAEINKVHCYLSGKYNQPLNNSVICD